MMDKLNGFIFCIDVLLMDVSEKYSTIWDKVSANIKKNLIASLFTINNF